MQNLQNVSRHQAQGIISLINSVTRVGGISVVIAPTGYTSSLTCADTHIYRKCPDIRPWAHGHQIKALAKFVLAIIDTRTGCQAALARSQGNQEAAVKQLSRLLHNPRLKPKDFA